MRNLLSDTSVTTLPSFFALKYQIAVRPMVQWLHYLKHNSPEQVFFTQTMNKQYMNSEA